MAKNPKDGSDDYNEDYDVIDLTGLDESEEE